MVFRSQPLGACCMLSGRLQGFIPQKLAHFEEHMLTLHIGRNRVRAKPREVQTPTLDSQQGLKSLHIYR
jgi:Ran GTPase-activating protein (RanGAP) involved in mRNA processing and transport